MRFLNCVVVFFLFTGAFAASAQDKPKGIPVNSWRCHLSYENGLEVVEAGDRIYCATKTGLFYVDKRDNSVTGLCKVDGFSDVFAAALAYSENYKTLFIGYQNGGFDVVQGGKIQTSHALLDKGSDEITGFYIDGDWCYITHKLGISEYNMKKHEIRDTYGAIWEKPNCATVTVKDVTIWNDSIYAVSELGLVAGNRSTLLIGCEAWNTHFKAPAKFLATFDNHVVAAMEDGTIRSFNGTAWSTMDTGTGTVYSMEVNYGKLIIARGNDVIIWDNISTKNVRTENQRNHAILDANGQAWMGINIYTLLREDLGTGKMDFYRPNGPDHNTAYSITSYKDEILVASGGLTEGGSSIFTNDGFYTFKDDSWQSYNADNVNGWFTFKDITTVVRDPRNNHLWVGSVDSGLVEISGRELLKFYNATNSCILSGEFPSKKYGSVAAMQFDENYNLWMTNYRSPKQLVVMTAKGGCYSFDLGTRKSVRALVIDNAGQIWTTAPRENAITVFNYGKKIEDPTDDQVQILSTKIGEGALPAESVYSMAKDRDGQIWIGTIDGVAVFPDPSLVFSGFNYDAQRIWVENGDESGYLLANEIVTAIAVDGGNRKWIGTRRGVFLTSPDGSKILSNFTVDNSPLISNLINTIGVNNKTGEVFFGTDKGIVSYRSTATEGAETMTDVYAFPNPVKPGYSGPISINGLVTDASVKITDISGRLVYETKAAGGQAVWYGKNIEGRDANSGVYLVFSSNLEGTETMVTKIMIVR
jgi:ligand-binding sensor domain-containing protein